MSVRALQVDSSGKHRSGQETLPAIVVAHRAELAEQGIGAADHREVVHQPAVKRSLLVVVVVVFVASHGNAEWNSERIDRVGIIRK